MLEALVGPKKFESRIRDGQTISDKYIQPGSIRVMGYGAWLPGWAFSMKRKFKETGLINLIHGILEGFARHKLGGVGGADLNFCAGLWVAA